VLNDQPIDPICIGDGATILDGVAEFFLYSYQVDDDGREIRIQPKVNLQSSIYRLAVALQSGL
jgi:hypothetical protein